MAGVPTTPPNTRTIDWAALVRKAWGDDWAKKETVYKFTKGREFKDSGSHSGIYSGTGA